MPLRRPGSIRSSGISALAALGSEEASRQTKDSGGTRRGETDTHGEVDDSTPASLSCLGTSLTGPGENHAPASSALVLAAGRSRRFGTTKLLASIGGRPLVSYAVGAALRAGVDEVIVVVGHDAVRVARAVQSEGSVRVAMNPDHRSGQASSLIAGVRALAETSDRVVVLLGDQPGVRPSVVAAVLDGVESSPSAIARARYDDGWSHPVAFGRSRWPELLGLRGDQGARELLARPGVADVVVEGRLPRDVDVPADLEQVVNAETLRASETAFE